MGSAWKPGASSALIYNLRQRHPQGHKPMIDYDLVSLALGIQVGVMCSIGLITKKEDSKKGRKVPYQKHILCIFMQGLTNFIHIISRISDSFCAGLERTSQWESVFKGNVIHDSKFDSSRIAAQCSPYDQTLYNSDWIGIAEDVFLFVLAISYEMLRELLWGKADAVDARNPAPFVKWVFPI